MTTTEYGSIEREIHVEASPDTVFDVLTQPEHLRQWWPDEVELDAVAGATGELVWGDDETPRAHVAPITVVDVDRPHRFVFRWAHPEGETATPSNSFLVTFTLEPSGSGTRLRMVEVGFREQGWEAAVLEEQYRDHCHGWDLHLPRLVRYVAETVATR